MKTAEYEMVCPYPGLRSFTEDESLYFKGRDQQIGQITSLLEQNKFLMLTGASGEGKSSLVYAGLIPNARAGFFRAQYTNWLIADFRPERTPVDNMSRAVAHALDLEVETVRTELKRGYSSLVDLYLNSSYHIDMEDIAWQRLTESERKLKKRTGANLLLIIDQFEEFFTNPENFDNESPSTDAQVVVNLALETARIGLKRNLPVFVVCTMRSDFIGQCSAFRGLPEYIGFSQFFVPRLKRKDFKQVIEEPAILSGNRISQRLIERLVFDLAEGVDQLPVLQHALSRIWLAADRGAVEMDLIHYAMVGGMPASELPDDDQERFVAWFEKLPPFQKDLFATTGLHKVIEFHANILYEQAWGYYSDKYPNSKITIKDVKRIIAMTFACLTKIDHSRAVRNRMSLSEITQIINEPSLTSEVVAGVLDVFREESNSFLRPFKTEDPETHRLSPESILDITHESLIRNWNRLNRWAQTEYDYYTTWLDFRKQLSRWIEHGKSRDFLLPIGPLTFFETWYDKCKPNTAWIARYLDSSFEGDARKSEASALLDNARQFIKKSANAVIVSRTFVKYGTRSVATALALLIMLGLSAFYWTDAEHKRNERVIARVVDHGGALLKSDEVQATEKARYLVMSERYTPGYLMSFLKGLPDSKARITLASEIYAFMLTTDNHFSLPVKEEVATFLENEFIIYWKNGKDLSFQVRQLNKYIIYFVYDDYYNHKQDYVQRVNKLTSLLHDLCLKFYKDGSLYEAAISSELNIAVQLWLSLGEHPKPQQIRELISLISPIESGQYAFDLYYPKGAMERQGNRSIDYNGGYHTLATLYATEGNTDGILACFEKLNSVPDYFNGRLFNNYNNVIGYMHQYGRHQQVEPVIKWISQRYPENTPQGIYVNMVNRSGYLNRLYFMNFTRASRTHAGTIGLNLTMASRSDFHFLADLYEGLLKKLPNSDEKNYLLAMQYKRRAMMEDKYAFDRGFQADTAGLEKLFDDAFRHFKLVSPAYLAESVTVPLPYWTDGFRDPKISRRNIFLYPDYMNGWFVRTFHTDRFFLYMQRRNLLDAYYSTPQDVEYLHFWLAKANELDPDNRAVAYNNLYPLSDGTLLGLSSILRKKRSDANLVLMMLSNRSFDRNDTTSALNYFKQIDFGTIGISSNRFEYLEKSFFLNQVKDLARNLAGIGRNNESQKVINVFTQNHEKAIGYLFNAEAAFERQREGEAFTWLDSTFAHMQFDDFTTLRGELDYRPHVINLLGKIGGQKLNYLSAQLVRDLYEFQKFDGVLMQLSGIAAEGNYFKAISLIPSTFTETQEITSYTSFLREACKVRESQEERKRWASVDRFYDWNLNYVFFIPF